MLRAIRGSQGPARTSRAGTPVLASQRRQGPNRHLAPFAVVTRPA